LQTAAQGVEVVTRNPGSISAATAQIDMAARKVRESSRAIA
jgi:hypothetical protein